MITAAILPPHAAGLSITHDDHKASYATVEDWLGFLEGGQGGECQFVNPEERQRAIEANEIWCLQWYPQTPVGSYSVYAASFASLVAWMAQQAANGWKDWK